MVKGFVGVALALFACAAPAFAQTSGSIAIGTDYMSRGTSQTYGKPAVMLYGEHQFTNGVYVAGFVANIDFDNQALEDVVGDDGTFAETDAFIGYRGTAGKVNYDVGVASINYLGTKKTPWYNPSGNWYMVEAYAKLSTNVEGFDLTSCLGISPDYFNNYGPSTWTEVGVGHAVTDKLYVNAAIGHQHFFEDSSTGWPKEWSNYITWNIGATYSLTKTLSADLRYHDNDSKVDLGKIYEPRVVATLRKTF